MVIHSESKRSVSPSGQPAQSLDEVSSSPQPPPSTCQHSPLSQEPKDSKSLPVLLYLTFAEPRVARLELGSQKKTQGVVGTASPSFLLSFHPSIHDFVPKGNTHEAPAFSADSVSIRQSCKRGKHTQRRCEPCFPHHHHPHLIFKTCVFR